MAGSVRMPEAREGSGQLSAEGTVLETVLSRHESGVAPVVGDGAARKSAGGESAGEKAAGGEVAGKKVAGEKVAGEPAAKRGAGELEQSEEEKSASPGQMREVQIDSWAEDSGLLSDGSPARLAVSCLVRPDAGDVALAWVAQASQEALILAILGRQDRNAETVLASSSALSIAAPNFGIVTGDLSLQSENLISNCRNRYATQEVHAETSKIRVSRIGTDIRKAGQVTDDIEGGFVQKMSIWISNTTKEARLRARAFMFE